MGVAQWTPAYVEKGLFKPAHVGANALLGFSLMMTVGRLGMGALRHRIPPAALMLTSTGLCVVCILAASALPPPLAISSLVIFGLCVACLWPTTLAYAADRIPGSGATLFSLLAVAGNAGCMVSPGWIGVIASKSSLRWGIAALTVFPLAATVLWGIQRLKEDPEV